MGKSRDTANLVSESILTVNVITDNVGIGSTIPTSKLDVQGSISGDNLTISGIITATDFNSTSDIKKKTNINKIKNPIEIIEKINGVRFNWKDSNKPSLGVIAQEIENVLPEIVSDTETKTVNYNGIIAVLIEVVKLQQTQINLLMDHLNIDKDIN